MTERITCDTEREKNPIISDVFNNCENITKDYGKNNQKNSEVDLL